MLQIKDIKKTYITGDLVQNALNGINLNLRENEFVAILGPSGSGKTTLLNIIGGLDRYDDGDLIINGISTKNYNDRDWDSYRNHTIGFVFQSYNLIPHQSILANVELSLTISGISSSERKRRSKEALEKVGLGDQIHKKPNQLSGGQMQRVAIARALVNNPDILLADEPTGALDSKTSIQIMELLKEVAKDRLVVMVTHNPELADEYATRIVRLQDGEIIDDSNPYIIDEEIDTRHENMGKASMSFLTSLALSFNNLKTKKGRTFLTAFAGSIGIIGIALILSLSNGVDTYIHNLEEDTLSEYPLTIYNTGFDLSSMAQRSSYDEENEDIKYEVEEIQMLSSIISTSKSNDLKSLKKHLDEHKEIKDYAKAIEYKYQVSPQIYKIDNTGTYRQVHPDQTIANTTGASYIPSMISGDFNVFSALPQNKDLYIDQYEVLEGRWPNNYLECVAVLTRNNKISDMVLYATALKDPKELDKIIDQYSKEEISTTVSEKSRFNYKDFIGIEFKLVNISDIYDYDSEYDLYIDKKDNKEYMNSLLDKSETIKIVGVVKPTGENASMLSTGIYYNNDLDSYVMKQAQNSEIVLKQKNNKYIDVFTGKFFDDENNDFNMNKLFSVDESALNNAFNYNANALNINEEDLGIDPNSMNLDLSQVSVDTSNVNVDPNELLDNVEVKVSDEELNNVMNEVMKGFEQEAKKDKTTDYTNISDSFNQYLNSGRATTIVRNNIDMSTSSDNLNKLISDLMSGFMKYLINEGISGYSNVDEYISKYLETEDAQKLINDYLVNAIPELSDEQINKIANELYADYIEYAKENELVNPEKVRESFVQYIQSDAAQSIITNNITKIINTDEIQQQVQSNASKMLVNHQPEIEAVVNNVMAQVMSQVTNNLSSQMNNVMGNIGKNMQNAFSFNASAFESAFKFNVTPEELQELMTSMMSGSRASYEGNLKKLNYVDEQEPYSIYIYPKDFECKNNIIKILDKYNSDMEKAGKDDKVISYTDYVATLMSSVTNIIDTISYVLVAFVAISLIVSSIMIGIITYISVLERTKEIGILRAIGASKSNISQVFNAETFIIGLLAGVMGIVISLLILIPGNALIHALTGNNNVSAILPTTGAIALIIISVILTLIGGLIPAKKAAKKDPVIALRSE